MDFPTRLRAAFLTSIADLFFGASLILIILVVLARPAAENQTPRFVDQQLWCQRAGTGWLLTTAQSKTTWTFQEWFDKETGGALLVRVGLWTARNEVDCYRKFEHASRLHNSRLTHRGTVSGSVAPILLPVDGARESHRGAP